jgi:hypothetical protein
MATLDWVVEMALPNLNHTYVWV